MSYLKRKSFIIILLGISFLILINTNAYPWWYINGSGVGYGGGDDSTNESVSTTAIGDYIVDGAGYFLDSYDKTLIFMKKAEWYEKQVVSNDELINLLDNALEQMKLAYTTYVSLNQLAYSTPYNPVVIEALKNFNYDGFQAEYNLNSEIFADVKNYLCKGDIRGVYRKVMWDTAQLIGLLNRVKEKLEAGVFPPLKEVWKLNQAYSQSLLFGQYISQVFGNL